MTWRRGFFRLWIFFAGLWLLGSSIFTYSQSPYFPERAFYFTTGQDAPYAVTTYSDEYNRLQELKTAGQMSAYELGDYPEVTLFLKAGKEPALRDAFIDRAAAFQKLERETILAAFRWDRLVGFLGFGIAFPLGVLVIGAIVSWVLSGFRSTKPSV